LPIRLLIYYDEAWHTLVLQDAILLHEASALAPAPAPEAELMDHPSADCAEILAQLVPHTTLECLQLEQRRRAQPAASMAAIASTTPAADDCIWTYLSPESLPVMPGPIGDSLPASNDIALAALLGPGEFTMMITDMFEGSHLEQPALEAEKPLDLTQPKDGVTIDIALQAADALYRHARTCGYNEKAVAQFDFGSLLGVDYSWEGKPSAAQKPETKDTNSERPFASLFS
jgi:hypothetical protein